MRFWCVVLLMLTGSAVAEVYEWVDENGQRHFSDQKPPQGVEFDRRKDGASTLFSTYQSAESLNTSDVLQEEASGGTSPSARRAKQRARKRKKQEARCASYLRRMERVQDQLRRGYREPKGNQLRRKRRNLSRQYQQACHK